MTFNLMVSTPAIIHHPPRSGPRPLHVGRDMRGVLELLDMVFGSSLDAEGRRYLADGSTLGGAAPSLLGSLSRPAGSLPPGFVWEESGRIVGNVSLLRTGAGGRYVVANVAVHPGFRRRGMARRLMQETIQAVRAHRGQVIALQVEEANEGAIRLYRSLGFVAVGSMTTWEHSGSRLRGEPVAAPPEWPFIRELRAHEWRAAYFLDRASLHPDLRWPEPLTEGFYRRTLWRRLDDFLNGRQTETWVTADERTAGAPLVGLATIDSEWSRPHQIHIRVSPAWRGFLESHLLAKALRRLRYLSERAIRLDHPADDAGMNRLLTEARFTARKTLAVMRLDLVRSA
ncbi:MAG: GNAT family N-acetyltransferase [Chloroflexota bacterium]